MTDQEIEHIVQVLSNNTPDKGVTQKAAIQISLLNSAVSVSSTESLANAKYYVQLNWLRAYFATLQSRP